ncbi:hypothetical protein PG999_011077 [Apiospora kogelbergensis]|uniref:Uncharacterized protein n=1 Tax=Apiospora kogelbergensis TaxID=1337665 RepID=A0AAW0QHN0_9PEZI
MFQNSPLSRLHRHLLTSNDLRRVLLLSICKELRSPSQGGPPPSQQQQPPQYAQGGPQGNQQQYPPRDQQPSRVAAGKQPANISTSSPPPQPYSSYPSQPPVQGGQRPQSTYGNPQELATSAYDSPVAPHRQGSGDLYSASVYSTEDPYASSSPTAPSAPPPLAPGGPPQGVPTPLAVGSGPSAPSAPSQPQYSAYNPQQQQQQQQAPAFDAPSAPSAPSAPTNAPPPMPTSAAPPIPAPLAVGRPPNHDARQGLPSQMSPPPGQAQFKAYVPPGSNNEPSAPQDFYRQSAY